MRQMLLKCVPLLAALWSFHAALAQPASTDLGALALPSSTSVGFNLTTNTIVWYRFTLTTPISLGGGTYADIDTVGSAPFDTEIGLYDATGLRIANDDDDAEGNRSALSFGAGSGLPAGVGGQVSNGRDGNLPPGLYYLAIGQFNVTFGAAGWTVTSNAVAAGGIAGVTITLGGLAPPPPNDNCPSALPIGGPGPHAYDTAGGTPDGPAACEGNASPSVWFSYTAPDSQFVEIRTCGLSTLDTVLAVFDSCGGTVLACDDDFCGQRSQVTLPVIAGNSYLIRVSHFGTASGSGSFVIQPAGLLGTGSAAPDPVTEGQFVTLSVAVNPASGPPSTGIAVSVDATTISGGLVTLSDDGIAPDVTAGDLVYTAQVIAAPLALGAITLPFTVSDAQARTFNGSISFTVLGTPLGACCGDDNSCTILRQYECIGLGGSFAGPGTHCGGLGYITSDGSPFEDISAFGTEVSPTPGDDTVFVAALPFSFSYFGNPFNSVNISTNGNVQFAPSNSNAFNNVPIPNSAAPNNMLAAMWDDFNFNINSADGLHTASLTGPDRFIIQWTNVAQFNTVANTDFSTFQIVLFSDGCIEFRYANLSADFTLVTDAGGATVGLEDAPASFLSLHIGTGAAPVAPNSSLRFCPSLLPDPCVNDCGGGQKIFEQIDFSNQNGNPASLISQSTNNCPACLVVPSSYACIDDFEINGLEGVGQPQTVGRAEALIRNTGPLEPTAWRVNIHNSLSSAQNNPLGNQYHETFPAPTCTIPNYTARFPGYTLVVFELGTGSFSTGSRTLQPLTQYWMSIVAVTAGVQPDVVVGVGDLNDPFSVAPNAFEARYFPLPRQQVNTATTAAYRLRGPTPAPPCPADFNHDGNLDPDDLGDYINCFFAEPPCPQVDFNNDGNTDPDDLGDFINAFFGGGC